MARIETLTNVGSDGGVCVGRSELENVGGCLAFSGLGFPDSDSGLGFPDSDSGLGFPDSDSPTRIRDSDSPTRLAGQSLKYWGVRPVSAGKHPRWIGLWDSDSPTRIPRPGFPKGQAASAVLFVRVPTGGGIDRSPPH